jgi:hypothetical protein
MLADGYNLPAVLILIIPLPWLVWVPLSPSPS